MSLRDVSSDGVGHAPVRQGLAGLAAAAILVGAAAWMAQPVHEPIQISPPRAHPAAVDPLAAERSRCQALGEAGARDLACLQAWAEGRQRFLAVTIGRPTGVAAGLLLASALSPGLDRPLREATQP